MKSSIAALFVATTCAWFIGVTVSGRGVFNMSWEWGIATVAASSLLAWLVERGCSDARRLSSAWMWLLYGSILASTCAWYVEVRGAVLYAELVLPTMAVWIVLMPIRVWVGRRLAAGPRPGADSPPVQDSPAPDGVADRPPER